jgi:hypothetical protein
VTEEKPKPFYTGMKQHADEAGFALWLPSDWHQFELQGNMKGVLFSPYPDDFNTGLLAEKKKLKVKVKSDDLPILREAFMEGIRSLEGVEIEEGSVAEHLSNTLSFFEVRFSFLDGGVRRKRWIRNIYWGRNNYVLIAQGRTVEDFQYWLPMFYNIMMTVIV